MKLLTKEIEKKLIDNHKINIRKDGLYKESTIDHRPVVKYFGGNATWLFSEYNPESNLFFGLCDLGLGEPELGYVDKDELFQLKFPPFGLPLERDLYFTANKTITEYADLARKSGRVIA